MGKQEPVTVVLAFLEAINARDVGKLCGLMTEDHLFVDALGNQVQGKEAMRNAWKVYFTWFPDYRVSHEKILSDGPMVAVFGEAEATYAKNNAPPTAENHWQAPAAWRAVVRDGLLAEWRVYVDNQAARKIMGWPHP